MRPLVLLVFIVPGAVGAPSFVAVVPDLPGPGPGDEGFAVDAAGTDLAGWWVTDGEGTWILPSCAGVCWFTGNASLWSAHDGPPATPWDAPDLQLANAGDGLALHDPNGDVVDHVAWGPHTGLPYRSPGVVYTHGPDGWVTPRIHRIGESDLDAPTFLVDRVTLYASPDSSYSVLSSLIGNASWRLHLHVHELDHPWLVDALVDAKTLHPDLDLQVLIDGRVPGRSHAEERALHGQWGRLVDAGGNVVVAEGGRYAHHHLKVLVADDAVAVQTENWNRAGVPVDPSWGNRGWGVVVHDADFADWTAAWMQGDRSAWDVTPLLPVTHVPPPSFPVPQGSYRPLPAVHLERPIQVTPVVSPDHTADPADDPVLAAMQQATHRIWGQQLHLDLHASNRLGWSTPDPYAVALADAARRGVDVQLQLAAPFGFDDTDNARTAEWLHQRGVAVTTWQHPALATLHNKAWIIDDAVFLGSMNGHHASRSNNREVGVLLQGPDIAAFYGPLMESDRRATDAWPLPMTPVPILLVAMAVARACRAPDAVS